MGRSVSVSQCECECSVHVNQQFGRGDVDSLLHSSFLFHFNFTFVAVLRFTVYLLTLLHVLLLLLLLTDLLITYPVLTCRGQHATLTLKSEKPAQLCVVQC